MKEKAFIIPLKIMEDLNKKGKDFTLPLFFALCDYFFKGVDPQHLTKEQNEYFKFVTKQIKITWI